MVGILFQALIIKDFNLLFPNMTKRILYPLFFLLIPLIGTFISDEINWSLFDFIVMGFGLIFLGAAINFVVNREKNLKRRIMFIGIFLLIFLVVWAEIAVGVFGTSFAGS